MAKSQNRKKIIITSVLAALVSLVGLVALIVWLSWSGSTKEIEIVADRVKPDSSWKMTEHSTTPPRTLCIDSTCPQVVKHWIIEKDTTDADINMLAQEAGFNFSATGDCSANTEENKSSYMLCKAHGSYNDYQIQIYTVRKSDEPNHTELILEVNKNR